MKKFAVMILTLLISVTCYAETRYTTGPQDSILRSGPSEYAEASNTLVPNTEVTVIGIDRSTGYALIVTKDHFRGWVPLHQLTNTAPTQPVLLQPKAQAAAPSSAQDADKPTDSDQTSEPQAAAMDDPKAEIKAPDTKELEAKSYTADVKDKLHALASASAANPNSLVKLTPQEMTNYVAIQRENRAWFITGAGILIIGMLIGIIIARITRRRRTSWG